MIENDIKIKIKKLRKKITKWNIEYFKDNKPSVTDYKYDKSLKQLIDLEKKHPQFTTKDTPTLMVGSDLTNKFKKYKHNFKMMSLSNAFDFDDLVAFDKSIKKLTSLDKIEYFCELKIDGMSVSLIYNKNKLKIGASRGNGEIGENITDNIRQISDIPDNINVDNLNVRGEAYLRISEFNKLNKQRKNNNLSLFANPRNAVAGTLRNLDSSIVKKRNLNIFLYQITIPSEYNINFQSDVIAKLKEWNFPVNNNHKISNNIDQVWTFIQKISKQRNQFDYHIDGVVIKVNNLRLYPIIKETSKSPKWAIAYKFSPTILSKLLLKIYSELSGETGKITYNAQLESVLLDGSMVKSIYST